MFRGVEFRGVSVTRNEGELRSEDGGLLDASELVVCIAKSRLSQAPKVNEPLGYGGDTWLIRSVAGLMQWEQEWILKVSK